MNLRGSAERVIAKAQAINEARGLTEGDVSFHEKPDDYYKDGRTMVHVHHKGKHVATIQKYDSLDGHKERHVIVSPDITKLHSDNRFNQDLPDKYKKKTLFGKVKPGQEHEKVSIAFDSRRAALRHAKNVYSGKVNEEVLAESVKLKETKALSNNPGNGYHGVALLKHSNDADKAHVEFRKMHAKVKQIAGEAGHLGDVKKPNVMIRDYLDSKRGRHLHGYENDGKYIAKDFGHFKKTYDPKLFKEEAVWGFDDGTDPTTLQRFLSILESKRVKPEWE